MSGYYLIEQGDDPRAYKPALLFRQPSEAFREARLRMKDHIRRFGDYPTLTFEIWQEFDGTDEHLTDYTFDQYSSEVGI